MELMYEAWEVNPKAKKLGIVRNVLYDEYQFQIHLTTFVNGKFKDIDENLIATYEMFISLLKGNIPNIQQWKGKWIWKNVELRPTQTYQSTKILKGKKSSKKPKLNRYEKFYEWIVEQGFKLENFTFEQGLTLPQRADYVDEETGHVHTFDFEGRNKNHHQWTTSVDNVDGDATDILVAGTLKWLKDKKSAKPTTSKPKPTPEIKGLNKAQAQIRQEVKNEMDWEFFDKEAIDEIKTLLKSFQGVKFANERAILLKELKNTIDKENKNLMISTGRQGVNYPKALVTPANLLDYYYTQTTQSPVNQKVIPCKLPTPNGKESLLPLHTYLAVREVYFKKWFGDWEKAYEDNDYSDCSKIIDQDTKEPKIMYHAVRKFVPNFGHYANMGVGVKRPYGDFTPPSFPASYFSPTQEYVEFYGGIAKNQRRPTPDYQPFIYNVFLNMRNPIDLAKLGFKANYNDIIQFLYVAYGINFTPSKSILQLIPDIKKETKVWGIIRRDVNLIETIKDYGFDGIIQIGDVPTFTKQGVVNNDEKTSIKEKEYLTFYANQVKSATIKHSFYLDYFKDIRFKKGGNVCI